MTPNGKKTPNVKKIYLNLSSELIVALKKEAHKLFGGRKNTVSMYVEMMMRNELHLAQPNVEET